MSGSDRPRYVCVHGHFYQPPRENPWLEAVERQVSARPYHDWNERITDECYERNAAARVLDGRGRLRGLSDNYARISFDFGPTLLTWLRRERPAVYDAILRSDRRSAERFGGHGSAMAQAYNHMILPLANTRDRRSQIHWGVEDFRFRFGRDPEGMWLPETAVDTESLELMAEAGIRFTVLAPRQVAAVRPPDGEWEETDESSVDTGRAYRVPLPSGREIAVFFYDGETSRAVAFERLLTDGATFAERLRAPLEATRSDAPLSHIATDGESYGHHHRHGEMALAYALEVLERSDDVELVNYGLYLERHPPTWEARIVEDSSWSCAHGVERWYRNCGCAIDPGRGTSQAWRRPLRDALDWLRDTLEEPYAREAGALFGDPWEARDRYIEVLVDRSEARVDRFLGEVAVVELDDETRTRALRLLEMQRHLLLMYTSCGWFFDDVGGIEAIQILQYAARAIHVATEVLPDSETATLEDELVRRLQAAPSNDPLLGDAGVVYRRSVEPARVDLRKAAAHYAVSSVLEPHGEEEEVYCYRYRREDLREHESGGARLAVGRVEVTSGITLNSELLTFAVVHLGNQELVGGVRPWVDEETYDVLLALLEAPFLRTEYAQLVRHLDREFQASLYSLRSLFRDAQLRIVDALLESSVEDAEGALARMYEERAPLLRFLADLGVPAPAPFAVAAQHVLDLRLARVLDQDRVRAQAVRALLDAASAAAVSLDLEGIAFRARASLERTLATLRGTPDETAVMAEARELVEVLTAAGVPLDLSRVQEVLWRLLERIGPLRPLGEVVEEGEEPRERWRRELEALAATLRVALPVEGVGPVRDAPAAPLLP